jgi:hypothetical protein
MSAFLEFSGQALQAAPPRSARPAFGSLLQLIGECSDDQIATANDINAPGTEVA